MRKCIGCGKIFDRKELLRIIRIDENNFFVCDKEKKKCQGRSAYMCKNMDCFLMSKKRKGFEHSFKFKKNKFDLAKKIYDEVEILLKILFK